MEKIGTLFDDYRIILYYDVSTDNTLSKIKAYQKSNPKLELFFNDSATLLPYRTQRIAKGRNRCLQRIRNRYNDYGYFIMIDCDDVCAKDIKLNVLRQTLYRDDWDSVSFNRIPYYDTWALSIRPFMYSFRHFENVHQVCDNMRNYVESKLKTLKKGQLLPCSSAFNGFAIYKTQKFLNCSYDGRLRLDLFSAKLLRENSQANHNMKFIVNRLAKDEQSLNDDCEHRAFHFQAIRKNNARIRISPEFLF